MDLLLIRRARALASRRRRFSHLPVLWLFSDWYVLPDPCPAVALLPRALSGVVFCHDRAPGRATLGRRLARLCRVRRIALVVAGDGRLAAALGAGVHLRRGRWPDSRRPQRGWRVASAHNRAELARAVRAGVDGVFLSPLFATKSHPEACPLGVLRWLLLARRTRLPVFAFGGVTGDLAASLPARNCAGFAAIRALAPPFTSPVAKTPQCFGNSISAPKGY